MTIEYIRHRIDPARAVAFVAACGVAMGPFLGSPHCRGAEPAACVEDPRSVILRIEWTSVEDPLQGFRRSPAIRDFLAAIRPCVGEIEEMRHYERIPLGAGA